MDLLPHPKVGSVGVEPLEIPCVADTPYSGNNFWDFPQTHGYGDRWITLPASRLASLAQSWLFFGTISEFLGRQIDYREFKTFPRGFSFDDRGDPEGSVVTLEPLVRVLDEWLNHRKQRSGSDRTQLSPSWKHPFDSIMHGRKSGQADTINDPGHDSDLYQLAGFLDKVFDLAEDFEQLSQGHIYPIPGIILSVKILCITLIGLCEQARLDTGRPPPMSWPKTSSRGPGSNPTASSLPSSQLLFDIFQQHGRCPFQVGKIMSTHNYAVVYYLTRIYHQFSPDKSHRGCSETECVVGNIADLDTYQPRHAEPTCRCRHLSVRADKIRDIILQGGIPLVRVTVSSRRKPTIKVVKMKPWTTPFMAFSHVWEDTGLGNPRANSLPKCQLTRLQYWTAGGEITNQGENPPTGKGESKRSRCRYFWIDTLCIPAGSSTTEARIQAINKISAVFQAAERVVVLDESLLKIPVTSTEPCELSARLSLSPWNSRCWAYLEASLNSTSLEVQCADGTFDPFSNGHRQSQSSHGTACKQSAVDMATSLTRKLAAKASPASDRLLLGDQSHTSDPPTKILISNTLLQPLTKELQSPFQIKSVKRRNGGTVTVETPDLCTTFIHTWGELSKRSATLPRDKHIMLATLLGFNTQPIQRLVDPQDRMAAILGNMDGLPLSLFLSNPGRRKETSKIGERKNAWMPLYPSPMTRLATMASSQYTNIRSDISTGDLYFPNNRINRREVSTLIIRPPGGSLALISKPGIFRVQDPSDKWARIYTIKINHWTDLELSADGSEAYCLLIRRASSSGKGEEETTTGSLFRVQEIVPLNSESVKETVGIGYGSGGGSSSSIWKSSSSLGLSTAMPTPTGAQVEFLKSEATAGGNMVYGSSELSLLLNQQQNYLGPGMGVRVVYESPVTVTPVVDEIRFAGFNFGFRDSRQGSPNEYLEPHEVLDATPLPPNWQMVLERDGPPPPQLTSHIANYKELTTTPPISTTFLLTGLDGLVAAGSVSMSLAICFTLLPLHLLSPMSSIAVVLKLTLHAISIIQLLLNDDDDYDDGSQQIQKGSSSSLFTSFRKPLVYDVLHLVTVAIYTISRVITVGRGRLNILDRTFVFWSFLGHTVNILAIVLVTRYFVVPRLWTRYLASFDDDYVRRSQHEGGGGLAGARFDNDYSEEMEGKQAVTAQDMLSPAHNDTLDNDLASESFLIPPWESHSHPYPYPRRQTSYGWSENSRDQQYRWESPYDNEPTSYPLPMEIYHHELHDPTAPGKPETRSKAGGGFSSMIVTPWSKVGKLIMTSFIGRTENNSRGLLGSSGVDDGNSNSKGGTQLFRRGRKASGRNVKGKQRHRRKLRTESMVVETSGTEPGSGSEYYPDYDRTSWRSGEYLLGEARTGR